MKSSCHLQLTLRPSEGSRDILRLSVRESFCQLDPNAGNTREFMNATPFIEIAIVYRGARETRRIVFVNSRAGSAAVKFTGGRHLSPAAAANRFQGSR